MSLAVLEPTLPAAPATPPAFPELADLLASLREQSARLADPSVALREGYRKLGPDFPCMGEHWIHPQRVIAGGLDPANPPVLKYASVRGEMTLVGAAFTHFLDPAADPPSFFGDAGVWLDHHESVDEEALFLMQQPSGPGANWLQRVALVHTWLLENPCGVTAQNNWRLPFLRLGLDVPADVPPQAARALSLLGGESYYAALFDFAGWLDPRERALVAEALQAHAAHVDEWVRQARAYTEPSLGDLGGIWRSLWCTLQRGLDPKTYSLIAGIEAG